LEETIAAVDIPVYGVGVIKIENMPEVLKAGPAGVAIISAILAASEVRKSAEAFVRAVGEWRLQDEETGRP
ncbi:MAG: hypothetical protein AAB356_06605, partial [Deltaproteobacteria bacterium]